MLTNKRLILCHFWLAFIVFGAALVLGAWQMFVRSPLNVWHLNPEFYYRSVTVRAIGQQYSFTPQCIVVPAETPITLRATSADVVHGLLIEGTNINTMLVPGYVSVLPTRFNAPREHVMPCQEFCGIGHQGMWGKVKVIDKAAFLKLSATQRRLTCVD